VRAGSWDELDEYLEQFRTMAERAGSTVHLADDADAGARKHARELLKAA